MPLFWFAAFRRAGRGEGTSGTLSEGLARFAAGRDDSDNSNGSFRKSVKSAEPIGTRRARRPGATAQGDAGPPCTRSFSRLLSSSKKNAKRA